MCTVSNTLQCYLLAGFSCICKIHSAATNIYIILYFSLITVLCILHLAAHYAEGGKNAWPNLEPVYKGGGENIEGQGSRMCQHKLSVSMCLDDSLALFHGVSNLGSARHLLKEVMISLDMEELLFFSFLRRITPLLAGNKLLLKFCPLFLCQLFIELEHAWPVWAV